MSALIKQLGFLLAVVIVIQNDNIGGANAFNLEKLVQKIQNSTELVDYVCTELEQCLNESNCLELISSLFQNSTVPKGSPIRVLKKAVHKIYKLCPAESTDDDDDDDDETASDQEDEEGENDSSESSEESRGGRRGRKRGRKRGREGGRGRGRGQGRRPAPPPEELDQECVDDLISELYSALCLELTDEDQDVINEA